MSRHSNNSAWKVIFACLVIFLLIALFVPSGRQGSAVSSPSRVDDSPKRELEVEKKSRESLELQEVKRELKKLQTMIAKPVFQPVSGAQPQAKPQLVERVVSLVKEKSWGPVVAAGKQAEKKPVAISAAKPNPWKENGKGMLEHEPKFTPEIEEFIETHLIARRAQFDLNWEEAMRQNPKQFTSQAYTRHRQWFITKNQKDYEQLLRVRIRRDITAIEGHQQYIAIMQSIHKEVQFAQQQYVAMQKESQASLKNGK